MQQIGSKQNNVLCKGRNDFEFMILETCKAALHCTCEEWGTKGGCRCGWEPTGHFCSIPCTYNRDKYMQIKNIVMGDG